MGTGVQLEGTWQKRARDLTTPLPGPGPAIRLRKKPSAKDHLASNHPFYPPLPLPERLAPATSRTGLRCHETILEGLRPLATGTRAEAPQKSPAPLLARNSRPAPPRRSHGPAPARLSPGEVAPAPPQLRGFFQHRGADSSRAGPRGGGAASRWPERAGKGSGR